MDRRVIGERRGSAGDRRMNGRWNDRRRDRTQRQWFDRAIADLPPDIAVDHLGAAKVAIRATIANQYRKADPIEPIR